MSLLGSRDPWLQVEEHMDRPDPCGPGLRRALDGLGFIYRHLGGSRCLSRALPRGAERQPGRILDVGCGGGELAIQISRCSDSWHLSQVVLVDFNLDVCRRAKDLVGCTQTTVVQSDARLLPFASRCFDVVHFGLFLHHFELGRIADLLRRALPLCRGRIVVSDLHRHWIPYLATRLGARISGSEMVAHDGPLSVRRGFVRQDLEEAADLAGFTWTSIRRVWPYRWLAVKDVDERRNELCGNQI